MKKTKHLLLMLLMLIFFSCPILTGCDFSFSSSSKLATPEISLNDENKCLIWDSIKNATSYDIYCNNKLADTIEAEDTLTMIYELVGLLGDSGEYVFEVVAKSDSLYLTNSNSSNSVKFNYSKKEIITPETPVDKIDESTEIKYTVSSDGYVSYLPLSLDNCSYVLYLYSNSTGLKCYNLSSNIIDLNNGSYMTKKEIYAIRMGYIHDGVTTITSGVQYYNPNNYGTYTSNIYLFDGYINDYYIENIQELKNLIYHTFINKQEEFNLKISPSFKDYISTAFDGNYMVELMDEAVYHCFKQFYETMSYQANNTNGGFVSQLSNSTEFKVKVSYGGILQCDTTIRPMASSINDQSESDAYYEIHDFETLAEKYGNDYDDFVSDKQFLRTNVTTSEQLYWAVENKVTPVITETNTRAYQIYNRAKEVLRNIISEDMTDYEKALCIFDWICINTSYDYTSYTTSNGYSAGIANYPTKLPCFYLEGVFITGNAVCDGFSKAYSLMCNMVGIDAIRIVGTAKTGNTSGGHAWNKVMLDINETDTIPAGYYLVDITWTEMVSNYGEELTHSYFGLSDADTKETHFPYANRKDKFDKFASSKNLRYYENTTFEHNGTQHDLVIKNTDELSQMFDYMLVDNRGAMEVVIDYDYMVSEYERIHGVGSYRSSNKQERSYTTIYGKDYLETLYDPATDTFYYYEWEVGFVGMQMVSSSTEYVYRNYKLRNTFTQDVMRPNKFQEQYLFLADDDTAFVYNNNGDEGLLYILTQNLLIDADGEIEHLVNYLDEKDVEGTFTLYIKDTILATTTGNTYLDRVRDLFDDYLASKGITITFEFKQSNHKIDNSLTASIYEITITEKVA